jgi:hypothetical protein
MPHRPQFERESYHQDAHDENEGSDHQNERERASQRARHQQKSERD